MFYVYILYSESVDLNSRVAKHNKGSTPSTRPYRPWEMLYFEEYPTKREAILREKEIKRQKSRKYLESLVAQ